MGDVAPDEPDNDFSEPIAPQAPDNVPLVTTNRVVQKAAVTKYFEPGWRNRPDEPICAIRVVEPETGRQWVYVTNDGYGWVDDPPSNGPGRSPYDPGHN